MLDIMVEDVLCCQYLLEVFNYQVLFFWQYEMQFLCIVVCLDVFLLVIFGGIFYIDSDCLVSSKVYQLFELGVCYFCEFMEMEVGCSYMCVVVLDNFVYVVGGQYLQYCSGEGVVDVCYCYDFYLNCWLCLQVMQESCIQFQLNVLCGMVYVIGGCNCVGSLVFVEWYCFWCNEWGYVCLLKCCIWGYVGVVLGGCFYILGGYGILVEDKKVLYCYDFVVDQWEFKVFMSEFCVLYVMVGVGGCIYVFGGCMDYVDCCFDVLVVEYYVLEIDQWISVSFMWVGQLEVGCCLLERKIYIVGGYNWWFNNVMGIVQVYNMDIDEWEWDLYFFEFFVGIVCVFVLLFQVGIRRQFLRFLGFWFDCMLFLSGVW